MTREQARAFIDEALEKSIDKVDKTKLRQAVRILSPGLHTSEMLSIHYATQAINLARAAGVQWATLDPEEPTPSDPATTPTPEGGSLSVAFPTPTEARFDEGSFTTAGAPPGEVIAGAQPPSVVDKALEGRFRRAAIDAGMTPAQVDAELLNFRNQAQDPAFSQQAITFFEARIADLEATAPAGPTPIGVGQDFVAQRQYVDRAGEMRPQVSRDFYSVQPRYFDGDEFSPAGLDPAAIATLQDRLANAGLLDPGEFWSGMWDALTINAYRTALGLSNASGRAVDETIDHMIATLPEDVKEARAREEAAKTFQAPPFMRPDKATLAQRVKDELRAALGRDPTPEDLAWGISGLGDDYRQQYESEVAAARSEFNANNSPLEFSGGGTIQAVDPLAQFRQSLEARFKPEMDRLASLPDVRDNMSNVFSSLRTMSSLIG